MAHRTVNVFVLALSVLLAASLLLGVRSGNGAGVAHAQKPASVNRALWCEICEAGVKEISKSLSTISVRESKEWEGSVTVAMEDLCRTESFHEYDHSPPKMVDACYFLLTQHADDMEELFMNRQRFEEGKEDLVHMFCRDMTQACLYKGKDLKEKAEDHRQGQADADATPGFKPKLKTTLMGDGSTRMAVDMGSEPEDEDGLDGRQEL